MAADRLSIEVVYAEPERQVLRQLEVVRGTTVQGAVELAALGQEFPGLRIERSPIAVWGRIVARDLQLQDGDRVEILRSLEIDPRTARRHLAEAGQVMGGTTSQPGDPDP
jgi:putative ubiquitin-RnfH superfamily antitoxin RatB of RatAB toxin-antitoxin module